MNNLQQQETFSLVPKNFPELEQMAVFLANSDFVPDAYKRKPGNVKVAIILGLEVGLKPIQALQSIYPCRGIPTLYGDACLALVKAHPDYEDIDEVLNEKEMKATCTLKRKGESVCERTFSQEDAEQAGLWNKKSPSPWALYPKRMLQCRARGLALRDAFPDALKGIKTFEEVNDYPEKEYKKMGTVEAIKAKAPKNMGSAETTTTKVNEKPIHATDSIKKTNGVTIVDPPGVTTETKSAVTIDDIKKAMSKHNINMDKFYNHYELSRIEELEGKDLGKILYQITSKPLRVLPAVIQPEELKQEFNKARDDECRADDHG